jgi:hypothetical protein
MRCYFSYTVKSTVKGMIFAQRLRNQALETQDPAERKLQLEVEGYKKVGPRSRCRLPSRLLRLANVRRSTCFTRLRRKRTPRRCCGKHRARLFLPRLCLPSAVARRLASRAMFVPVPL